MLSCFYRVECTERRRQAEGSSDQVDRLFSTVRGSDGHHSSDDISSTCMLMTLTRSHPLPRTVLNTHLIRGS